MKKIKQVKQQKCCCCCLFVCLFFFWLFFCCVCVLAYVCEGGVVECVCVLFFFVDNLTINFIFIHFLQQLNSQNTKIKLFSPAFGLGGALDLGTAAAAGVIFFFPFPLFISKSVRALSACRKNSVSCAPWKISGPLCIFS